MKSCSDCGRPSVLGRCPECGMAKARAVEAKRSPTGRFDRQSLTAAVRDRDGHRCVGCGAACPHPSCWEVDHIVGLGEAGGAALAMEPSNLRTFCDRCHNARKRTR